MRETNGAALLIDYGHAPSACGNTLQALRAHRFADPLAEPGLADLTAHVDFDAVSAAARREGAAVFGPITQREFLVALGARERAARLGPNETQSVARLISDDAMGGLFKVLALSAPQSVALPGFPSPNGSSLPKG